MAQYVAGSVALNTVPPVTLPPCINLSFTGFQILEPCGGLNAPPYFHVAGSNGPWFTAPAGGGGDAPLFLPAGAARGKLPGAGAGRVFCAAELGKPNPMPPAVTGNAVFTHVPPF